MENPSNGLNDLQKFFDDIEKKNKQTPSRRTKEDILSKYFVPRKINETFRFLPPKKGRKHIEEAFFHAVTTNTAGGKKKHGTIIYCPAHNDPKVPKLDSKGNPLLDSQGNQILVPAHCPLCEKSKKLLAMQNPILKGKKKENMTPDELIIKKRNDEIYSESNKWAAKKFYIVRGIDKGAEKDGVKFWRFKHNFKNMGTLDKLLPILRLYTEKNKADFADPIEGTDLTIITTDSEWNGFVYKTISAISANGKSKLHEDSVVAQRWLNDDITWRDVFLPKKAPNITSHQFLEMVANGNNPYWDDTDQNNKRWIFPGNPELEEMANTRNLDLTSSDNEDYEMASDLDDVESSSYSYKQTTDYSETELGDEILNEKLPETQGVQVSSLNGTITNGYVVNTNTSANTSNVQENDSNKGADPWDDLPF